MGAAGVFDVGVVGAGLVLVGHGEVAVSGAGRGHCASHRRTRQRSVLRPWKALSCRFSSESVPEEGSRAGTGVTCVGVDP